MDDYLLQLRFGKKFGFDFAQHRDKKVGVLRCFVKEQKTRLKAAGQTAQLKSTPRNEPGPPSKLKKDDYSGSGEESA